MIQAVSALLPARHAAHPVAALREYRVVLTFLVIGGASAS
ncbi:hypothetical protein Dthio_PD3485 [Desulfonatronospira thiodismutans ASO3-1]|uniref:Uncharacterized protein n=1 Tax=Desulfonatronospira thiodismutans ASO3-1 TaxID=555779 RepID=D6SMY1_9BACT|nr:hypothetical protein Dthio_PD3485 [Desulfonatronospira thiodismutans ASO3-1]